MSSLSPEASLKEINAYKKRISWGDVSALYHILASSLGDLDGILTHGFDSAYKQILNPNSWNLSLLDASKDPDGYLQVKNKPQISLRHEYNDMGYELHCYPAVDGITITQSMITKGKCPFNTWYPEKMQMLFRINSLVAFSVHCFQSGDEADIALLKFAHYKVEELITILSESFQIIAVKGYSIAEFYQEIDKRNGNILNQES
ncbi:hypothetical protein [Colwellia psychrerythraea]|uniref:Uncharacterized protein n=1 Tax=Colwellia psychrerythraea TaxID=28229 RepID=A0A099K9H0_COLPS|nr:hypothetical protein [Colwellia psychrerythraea]KGJ87384.1 hypothetical protein GAB14E_4539 [Colwellia psychrerythraea]